MSSSSSFWGWRRLLLSHLWCVCSACPGTPAVFPLRVMQRAALLWFHYWLAQVGCPTHAVLVSHGVGVVLVQMSCYPLVFLFCDCAASPSGICTLPGCVSLSDSSLLVYSWGWVGGVLLRPLPQGLRRTLFSLLQVPLGFSGHRGSVLLFPWWRGLGFRPSLLFRGFSCSACLLG